MAVQKHNTYYDNELYYYDENGVRQPLQVGKVYSAGSGIKIENDIISVSGKYVSSADASLDGKQLVLKNNNWEELNLPPSSDWLPTIKEASANAYNSAVDWVEAQHYLTEHQSLPNSSNWDSVYNTVKSNSADWLTEEDIEHLATKEELTNVSSFIENQVDDLSSNKFDKSAFNNYSAYVEDTFQKKGNYLSANALDDLSGNWESTYNTVKTNSATWNTASAKLDVTEFTAWSANADITPYSAGEGLELKDHKFTISAKYLSANALDDLSGVWQDAAKTLSSNSANWQNVVESASLWNNVYDEYSVNSAVWNDTTNTVNTFSSNWNEVSAKANSADLEELSAKVETLSGELKETSSFLSGAIDVVSAEFEKVVYTSATEDWDISAYKAGDNIELVGEDKHTISGRDWTDTIKEASANSVTTVEGKFEFDEYERISAYNGSAFANDDTKYTAGYGLDLDGTKFNVTEGMFALSADVDTEIENLKKELAKLGYYVCDTATEVKPNGEPNETVLESEGKLSTNKIYLVEIQDSPDPDKYREWIWDDTSWTCIGDTTMNLENYLTKTAAEEIYQKKLVAGNYIQINSATNTINVSGLHNTTLTSTNGSIGITVNQTAGGVEYDLSVRTIPGISGVNGISATYDETEDQYIVALEDQPYNYAEAQSVATVIDDTTVTLGHFENVSLIGHNIQVGTNSISLQKGLYHIDLQVNVSVNSVHPEYYDVELTNSLSNGALTKVIDGSYIHTETLDLSFDVKLVNSANTLTFTLNGMPVGSTYYIKNLQIHEIATIDGILETVGGAYNGGEAISIDNQNNINVKYDTFSGIGLSNNNELYVKLGKGLSFSNEGGVDGALSLDTVTEEVVDTVKSLQKELDNKLSTNMNISDAKVIGNLFNNNNVASMGCSLFTVPLQHNLTTASEISFFTTQGLVQNASFPIIFGILEYNFDYYDPETHQYRSQTKWIADTGPIYSNTQDVKGHAVGGGANKYTFKLKHLTDVISADYEYDGKNYHNEIGPVLRSDRAYYLTVFAKHPDGLGYILGDGGYNAVTNSDPYISWYADNCKYVDGDTSATMDNNWDGWNQDLTLEKISYWDRGGEANGIVRPFVMIRNVNV